jgi:hypothetical protein
MVAIMRSGKSDIPNPICVLVADPFWNEPHFKISLKSFPSNLVSPSEFQSVILSNRRKRMRIASRTTERMDEG